MPQSDYLLSKGWKQGHGKDEWLDPWQRAIRSLDAAFELQKAREVCNHQHTDKFTVKGVTRCGFCGEELFISKGDMLALLDQLKIGDCWCEKGTGNSAVKNHTATCEEAQVFVKKIKTK